MAEALAEVAVELARRPPTDEAEPVLSSTELFVRLVGHRAPRALR
jgi:hypothetical protein